MVKSGACKDKSYYMYGRKACSGAAYRIDLRSSGRFQGCNFSDSGSHIRSPYSSIVLHYGSADGQRRRTCGSLRNLFVKGMF